MNCLSIYAPVRLVARGLIAFEPSHGFAVFCGVASISEDLFPYDATMHLSYPGMLGGAIFRVTIREVQRKMPLPSRSWDTLIVLFDVVEIDNECPCLDWTICFDSRFDSPSTLLQRYCALENVPDIPSFYHDVCEEDRLFLEETHRELQRNVNLYREPYDALRTIQDRVRVGRSGPTCDAMHALLSEWKILCSTIGSDPMACLAFLETHMMFLESWCSQYLAEMTFEEKLRGWLTYGLRTSMPLAYFQEHWKLFFRLEGDDADRVVLEGTEFDLSYRHSRTLLARMQKEVKSAENTHLGLHPRIPCSNEGGTFCLRCEEARTLMAAEVYRSYRQRNNVFVNWERGQAFLDAWLLAVSRMTETDKATIHWVWPPDVVHHTRDVFFSWDGGHICTRDQFLQGLVTQRQNVYRGFEPREPDDVPRFLHLTLSPSYSLPNSLFEEGPNRWNDVYLFLLRFLSYAPTLLTLDKEYCQRFVSKVSVQPITE